MKRANLPLALVLASVPVFAGGEEDSVPHTPFPKPSHSGEGRIAFTSSNVQMLAWKTLSDFPGGNTSGNDCWGYTSPSGREYAIIGLSNGTAFVEVTDPGDVHIVDFETGVSSLWRSLKTHQNFAYAGSEGSSSAAFDGGGIQVFNLTNIDSGTVTLATTITTGGCTNESHTLAVDTTSGFLYKTGGGGNSVCGGSGPQGLAIYSLANPALPTFVGSWNTRYVHECQVVTWDLPGPHFGKQLAFCNTETGAGGGDPRLTILDVTNKAAITQLSSITYNGAAFSHQGWLSANKQHFYLNDELDDDNAIGPSRTRIIGLTSLTVPTDLGNFTSGATTIDHNLYVVGNRIYEGNYQSGLRIFDNTNPTAPTQIGWFDTFPEGETTDFNGLWSNYPFFASGTIVGGDLEKGLFVWRTGPAKLTFDYPSGHPVYVPPLGGTLQFSVEENTPGDLLAGTVKLHFDTGGPPTTVVASPLGGGLFQAQLPGIACGARIRYWVSAQDTDEVTWSDPPAGSTQVYFATAAYGDVTTVSDNMESATLWQVNVASDLTGFTTASTGNWVRVNPVGTTAAPEDDHSNPGTNAWVTGQGSVGGGVGEADVDSGATSLRSPVFSASGMSDPYVVYWRWYSNSAGSAPGEDVMTVDISNNNGASWTNVETVGPTGLDVLGGWIEHRARINDFVLPTANMRLRFRASDLINGSIIEAGVDDFRVIDLDCTPDLAISSVTPSFGGFEGGELVTITGDGFVAGVTGVQFGPYASGNVTVLDANTLQCVAPRANGPRNGHLGNTQLKVPVTVTQGPLSASLINAYVYLLPQKSL